MTWLTPGLSDGDDYECRDCGSSFVVGAVPEIPCPAVSSNLSDQA